MSIKRFFYSLLLILFTLALLADLGLWFLVPEESAAEETGAFAFTAPEGMSLPEGVTVPSEGSLPEGVTLPEGGSFSGGFPGGSFDGGGFPGGSLPEGMTFPGGESGEGSGRPSRPGRTAADGETETDETDQAADTAEQSTWLSEKAAWLQQYLPLDELAPIKALVSPYRLYVLIGAALGMVLCILRLIFLNKKIRRQRQAEEAENVSLKRVALWPAFLLLLGALVLVVILFPVNEGEEAEEGAVADEKVLSGTVEEKTLTSLIQSAGSLAEQEAVSLNIPASITVSSVCVRNGDTVTAGQIVAQADRTSVMKAIAAVHEVLADIDGQLQAAHEEKADTALTAPVAGTVKVVYAEAGEQVLDVMNDHGSLMLLSLDGRMAVQVPAAEDLSMNAEVTVTLSDGTELLGQVSFLEEGVATVTVVDRGYAIGEQVSVKTAEGELLGSGPLYVHKSLNVTGYLGTVSRIYRKEGSTVSEGTALIGLYDTADLAEYQALLQQRAEYEAELKTLFELYETGYIHAPCDGVISGLSDELAYVSLSNMVAGLTVRPVSSTPAEAEPSEYFHYLGKVTSVNGSSVELEQVGEVNVSGFSSLPDPSGYLTGTYTIRTSSIYMFDSGWNVVPISEIQVGDKLLFTFDPNDPEEPNKLVWVIVEHTEDSTPGGEGGEGGGQGGGPGGSGTPGGWGGGGIRIPSGGSGANTAVKKPAYTIEEQELCVVTPQERMLITVPVDEMDVLSLSLGQKADLYLDALPSVGLTAVVTEIDPEGENSGGNTKYSVTLALDRTEQLYPGMNGTVCFPRSEGKTVPTVPLAAVEEKGSRTVVYTGYSEETNELTGPVAVETGISDGTDVEITAGLSVGETYYYRYADSISYVTE